MSVFTGGQFDGDTARYTDGWFSESAGPPGDFVANAVPRDVFAARVEVTKASVVVQQHDARVDSFKAAVEPADRYRVRTNP